MNYQKKFLKYKTKYLNLKNQIGGRRLVGTYSNNGSFVEDGVSYTNQCFWISILQFLRSNGHPALKLSELKVYADLDPGRTKNEMFDLDILDRYRNNIYFQAAENIALNFNLRIEIYLGTRSGSKVNISDSPEYSFPTGDQRQDRSARLVVPIVNLYNIHFELINFNGSATYTPAFEYKGILTKIDEIPSDERTKYLKFYESEGIQKAYSEIKELEKKYFDIMKEINASTDEEGKKSLLAEMDKTYNIQKKEIIQEIEALKKSLRETTTPRSQTPNPKSSAIEITSLKPHFTSLRSFSPQSLKVQSPLLTSPRLTKVVPIYDTSKYREKSPVVSSRPTGQQSTYTKPPIYVPQATTPPRPIKYVPPATTFPEPAKYVPPAKTPPGPTYVSQATTPPRPIKYVPPATTFPEPAKYVPPAITSPRQQTTYVPQATTPPRQQTTYVPQAITSPRQQTTYVPQATTPPRQQTTYVPQATTPPKPIKYVPPATTFPEPAKYVPPAIYQRATTSVSPNTPPRQQITSVSQATISPRPIKYVPPVTTPPGLPTYVPPAMIYQRATTSVSPNIPPRQ